MTTKFYALVPAMVLAIGTATVFARPTLRPFAQYDQATLMEHGALLRSFDQGSAMAMKAAYVTGTAAYIGDGASPNYVKDKQELLTEPGYSTGTGAYASDGSDPSYLSQQQELLREPGYSVGTGAARVRD